MQTTLGKTVAVSGIGLHTGCAVTVGLAPAPVNTGIVFRRTDLRNFEIPALRRHVSRVVLATTLMKQGVMLSTVEHLLSALYGLGIDNAYVDIDSLEVPILDGSAEPFVEMVHQAGVVDQEKPRILFAIEKKIELRDGQKFISITPSSEFRITYEIDFEHPLIRQQKLDLVINPENYASQIAFARTFGFLAEVEHLRKSNLVRGGSLENAVVLDDTGLVSGELRAPDEFVRHKTLDLIGDISLCGFPLLGHIRAFKAGHALHTALAAELHRQPAAGRLVEESVLECGGSPPLSASRH